MTKKLELKDKRALIICGVAIILYVLGVFVLKPFYLKQKGYEKQIQNKIFFIKKYYEILNQKAFYDKKNKVNQEIDAALSRRFLNDKKPALAAAALQKIITAYAKKSSVNIESSRIEKPKYFERLLTVPVEINIKSDLRNLTQFINLIENHQKFMVVEELSIRKSNKTDPEELQTRLLILGFIQQLEPKKPRKI